MNVPKAGCLGLLVLITLGGLGSASAEDTERRAKHLGTAIPTTEEIVNSLQLPCEQVPGCSRQIQMRERVTLTKPVETSISTSLVNFETGSSKLSRTASKALDAYATALQDPRAKGAITIEGHADKRGSDEINDPLSQARAEVVVSYLTSKGVDPSRLKAVGKGSHAPIDLVDPTNGLNRRVEFVVIHPAGEEVKQ
jgi:outer membrane protein OmpA-like peptidoglycan-associated protein